MKSLIINSVDAWKHNIIVSDKRHCVITGYAAVLIDNFRPIDILIDIYQRC